ncbi:MAG: hypothetical protein K9L76_00095 [Candidatus Omnitrophica bacterium]|nr:hypothetical protein [Candidatus Omnitrophota bacterium]
MIKINKRIMDLYKKLEPFLDKDFLVKLQTEKERIPRESELLVGDLIFTQHGLQKKLSSEGPDFLFSANSKKVWVEVVAPANSVKRSKFNKFIHGEFNEVNEKHCKLALSGAVSTKKDKFNDYIDKTIVSIDDIKIIAINSYNLGKGSKSCPYIIGVLYGIDQAWYVNSTKTGVRKEFIKQNPLIKSFSGSQISLGLFDKKEYAHIDGVLYFDHSLYRTYPENEFCLYSNKGKQNKLKKILPDIKHFYCDSSQHTKIVKR